MAPHWSGMSVETYIERARQAANDDGRRSGVHVRARPTTTIPRSSRSSRERVADALDRLAAEERADATVIFSAHSLPVRTLDDGTQRCKTCDCDASCRYRDGLQETADLVAARLGPGRYTIAWQSAGRTDDPWWGPPVERRDRARSRRRTLRGRGVLGGVRRRSPGDPLRPRHRGARDRRGGGHRGSSAPRCRTPIPRTSTCLAAVVREHLAEVPARSERPRDGSRSSAAASPASRPRTGCAEAGVDVAVFEASDRPRREARGRPGRRPPAGGRRRLVRRAQAVGGRALPRARTRRRARGPGRERRVPVDRPGLGRVPEGRAVRDPRRHRRRVPLARAVERRVAVAPRRICCAGRRKDGVEETLGGLLRRRFGDEATDRGGRAAPRGAVRRRRRSALGARDVPGARSRGSGRREA